MPQCGLLGRAPGEDKPLPAGACDGSFRGFMELTGGSRGPQRFCKGAQPRPLVGASANSSSTANQSRPRTSWASV